MGIIGSQLYSSEFGGNVVSMPLTGGSPTTLLTGFLVPTVGLGTHAGRDYVGELTGQAVRLQH